MFVLLIVLLGTADCLKLSDSETFSDCYLYFGPQLAIAEDILYQPSSGSLCRKNLVACTMGDNTIQLFEVTSGTTPQLTVLDLINYPQVGEQDFRLFDPSFMQLTIGENTIPEWCLVVPVVNRGNTISYNGDILIVRLQERSFGSLVRITNTLGNGFPADIEELYHVAQHDGEEVAITYSMDYAVDSICIAEFDGYDFNIVDSWVVPEMNYAHNGVSVGARPYETTFFDDYGITTNHNGGIFIWDPETNNPDPIVSRIGCQQGWWNDGSYCDELGDVHRCIQIEGNAFPGSSQKAQILICANLTMGVTIYDISDMTNPFYVWQWDKDTGVDEGDLRWMWHGSGCISTAYVTTTNSQPAVTFGIDWFGGDFETSDYDPIHLYIGNGCDGLRVLDLTGFIHPWGMHANNLEFDKLATYTYDYPEGLIKDWAFDVRRMIIGHDVFVLTSWRDPPGAGSMYTEYDIGTISLTLHKETELASLADYTYGGTIDSQVPFQTVTTLSNPAPNPASSAQRIDVLSGGIQTASFRIFDIAGRLILEEDVHLSKGQNTVVWTEFTETLLPSGNYFISVTAENGSVITTSSVLIR